MDKFEKFDQSKSDKKLKSLSKKAAYVRPITRSFNRVTTAHDDIKEDLCLHPYTCSIKVMLRIFFRKQALPFVRNLKDFELGTNFYSWACQIAYWKVRSPEKFATAKVVFNQVLDVISQTMSQMEENSDHRHEHLVA